MGALAQIAAMPFLVFHRKFIEEFGARIAQAVQKQLLSASDKSLRDVRKEQIDVILKAIADISKRFLESGEREKQAEVLKL